MPRPLRLTTSCARSIALAALALVALAAGLDAAQTAGTGGAAAPGPAVAAPATEDGQRAPDALGDPLPRWPDTGRVPDDARQRLTPFAIDLHAAAPKLVQPTSGVVASPPEYSPSDGVIFRFATNSWASVVTECVAKLTGDPSHDERAFVVVSNGSQQSAAVSQFTAAGADLSRVVFITEPTDSIWLRDYGPHFIWQSGAQAIVDSHYYPTRPLDNFIPTLLAQDQFVVPAYPMGLYYSGGNFQPGPGRQGFITSLINSTNPEMDDAFIGSLYQAFQGIDTLHILPRLPSSVDGTGHIDMWMYLVDEDDVVISEFLPGSNATAIQITNDAVPYMQALGFTVHRMPAWNVGATHYTYTNAFRVNDRIFVPIYGPGNASYLDEDATSLAAWAAAAGPGVELVTINCYSIIPAAGAIHCIVMQVPRHVDPLPAAHLVAPDGGELVCAGETEALVWSANDDNAITSVDLSYSVDDGLTYPFPIAAGQPDDGRFDWLVPDQLAAGARVRVSAHDGNGNVATSASESSLEIAQTPETVYTFASGAGVDRWGWGSQTASWSDLQGVRHPAGVATPLDAIKPGAWAALATSNATGGDTDANRYIAPIPSAANESTHIFEFTIAEAPAAILDIGVAWEGYGDDCLQMELYVWDGTLGDWGDGAGAVGQNHYLASAAGNRDAELVGHIRGDFSRYVDGAGKLTLLLYAERSGQESFHDTVAVTVAHAASPWGLWSDLQQGLAGTHGVPSLVGSGGLLAGQPIRIEMAGALESTPTMLIAGLSAVSLPFKGGLLVPNPQLLVPGPTTSAAGSLLLTATWSPGVPPGVTLFLQAWNVDGAGPVGLSASNGIVGTTP